MISLLIDNVCVMEPGKGVVGSSLLIRGGQVAEIDPAQPLRAVQRIDGGGRLLTPGLIDLHTHGMGLNLFEQSPEAMRDGLKLLARYGVTCPMPTLYTVMHRQALKHLEQLTAALEASPCVSTPGFHLEGPFLALPGANASTIPGDLGLLKELLAAAKTAVMSISPDTPNIIPVIEHLVEQSITVFITHTRASAEQTQRAIDAGASHGTHFYDVFPVPEETDPGVRPVGAVETILANEKVSMDFVTDGVHVHPMAIRAALAAKGYERVCVITDSYLGAGNEPGVYDTGWGYPIKVSADGAARINDPAHRGYGALSGSCLTMDRAISNVMKWLSGPEHDVWRLGTSSPAAVLGLKTKGTLLPPADADLVLWDCVDKRLRVVQAWVGGRCVHEAERVVEPST